MRGEDGKQEAMFRYVSPERPVPPDHPLRPVREMGITPNLAHNEKRRGGSALDERSTRQAGKRKAHHSGPRATAQAQRRAQMKTETQATPGDKEKPTRNRILQQAARGKQ